MMPSRSLSGWHHLTIHMQATGPTNFTL